MYESALAELDELGFSIQPNFFPKSHVNDCRNELVTFIEDTSPQKHLL